MRTIDMHAHIFPVAYLELLSRSNGPLTAERSGDAFDLWFGRRHFARLGPEFFDPDRRLQAMDEVGVDVQVLTPGPPFLEWVEPERAVEVSRLLNDHMVDLAERSDGRFLPAAVLPLQCPDAVLGELRRVVDTGHQMVLLPTRSGDTELDDPALLDVFEEAERLDMGLLVHPIGRPGTAHLNAYRLDVGVGFTTETTLAAARLMLGGYLDRFPRLKLCLSHLGGSLLWLHSRIEMVRDRLPGSSTVTTEGTAGLIGRFFYDTMVVDADQIRYAIDLVGASRLIFGTDAPYFDDQTAQVLAATRRACNGAECAAVLSENADHFLHG